MIDGMAERYGMLPSQVLANATTQDVYIYDVYNSYIDHVRKKQESKRKNNTTLPQATPVNSDKMLEGLEKFKQRTKKI